MTPNHALFRRLFGICSVRVSTFDYLPNAESKYPFVYIGEQGNVEAENHDLYGTVRQTVHIYGLRKDRANLDDIQAYILSESRRITNGYEYHLNYKTVNTQLLPDNTDVQPLLHYVLDFSFSYNKKGK
ncbi:hypothetical protein ABPS01_01030 [Streptococcus sp. ZJ151]|uniref:hypothetical protein n=1 Tax=Streptococcus jiangjianxini TaxID=3161189 RepID=UPI0032F0504D